MMAGAEREGKNIFQTAFFLVREKKRCREKVNLSLEAPGEGGLGVGKVKKCRYHPGERKRGGRKGVNSHTVMSADGREEWGGEGRG